MQQGPRIGSLCDCKKCTNKQVHVFPTVAECKEDFRAIKTKQFTGEERQYKKQITEVVMYFCIAERIDKIRIEGFLGFKEKIRKRDFFRVTVTECKVAMMIEKLTHGRL